MKLPIAPKRLAWIAVLLCASSSVPCEAVVNRQRACSRGNVPNRNYAHDAVILSRREFAVANESVVAPGNLTKPFHFRALNVDLAHMRLYQVGLAIDGHQGNMMASGRISHNAGDGGMQGSHVLVNVRALMAAPANASLLTPDARQIPPDAVVVWESEQKIWVPAGDHAFTLVPTVQTIEQRQLLRTYFAAITHLEVEIAYLRDK